MMKNVTILTSNEMESIREDIDSMIVDAKDGAQGKQDARTICDWLVEDLKKLRSQFE